MAIETINPATGERLRSFDELTPLEIERKLKRARQAAERWRRTPIEERCAVVGRAGELLESRKEEYGRLMTLEMGKPIKAAIDEAAKCASACRYYAECAPRFLADQPVSVDG
ncbi:MAG TPA: aldehyde dehydrogenase family protein, partial [Gemmatimonadaceae bacterium]|nr:aldehyde dehydrogenase family protein [Gemmatimonadaceae bacterium]